MAKKSRKPIIGEAFTADIMDSRYTLESFANELEFYGRRRFSMEIANCRALIAQYDRDEFGADCFGHDWQDRFTDCIDMCCESLTIWAQTVNPYLYFGADRNDPESFGFMVDVESARDDSEFIGADLCELPRGFSGQAAIVNDHGNMTVYHVTRGRYRELFAIV